MRIIKTLAELKLYRDEIDGKNIGLIPTMGALHAGHESLIKKSVADNAFTIVSIFVNPTQFNSETDLEKYPSTIMDDINILISLGINAVFLPTYSEMYPNDFRYKITENEISKELCGKDRPGHFDGVLTIVMKLFNLIRPSRAYFGEKDYQQYLLIRDMAKSFFMDIEIIPCPTVRDKNGLALSSRNSLLSNEDKKLVAENFSQKFQTAKDLNELKTSLEGLGLDVDYLNERNSRRFGAIKMNNVRLIDNGFTDDKK